MEELKLKAKGVILLIFLFLVLLPGYVPAMATTEMGTISEEGATEIQNAFDATGIPSVQAAIVINDSLVWAKGYGEQASLDTVFRTGSITKTFTAAAFIKLSENGIIDLDDDVSDYLPFQVRNPNEPDTVITIRKILQHRSGMVTTYLFGYPYTSAEIIQLLEAYNYTGEEQYYIPHWNGVRVPLKEIINSTNINNPGLWLQTTGSATYSNTGYFFLSFLLEYITNDTWSNYIHDNILAPLGMDETKFNVTEYEQPVAFPHIELDNGTMVALPVYRDYGYGAGGLMTSATDISKFLIAVLNEGKYEEVQVFQPESVTLLKQYLQPVGSMLGYTAQIGTFEDGNSRAGLVLFRNINGYGAETIWSALLDEVRRIIAVDGDTTTTPPPPTDLPEYTLIVGLSIGIAVVAVGLVIITKRR